MSTLSDLPHPRTKRRLTFILRLWARGMDEPVWIGEVQDVQAGETVHVQGLGALFDLLKKKTNQALEPEQEIEPTTHTIQKKGKNHEV